MIDTSRTLEKLEERSKNAKRIFLASFVIAILMGVHYSLALSRQGIPWSYTQTNVQAFFLAFASLLSYWLVRQKQLLAGVFLFLGVATVTVIAIVLNSGGLDVILALVLLVAYLGISGATMPRQMAEVAITAGALLSIVIGFVGYWDPLGREYSEPELSAYLFAGIMLLLYGAFLRQQFRHYSLRTKLIIAFVVLSAVGVSIAFSVANFNIERVLSQNGRERIRSEAELAADKFDAFLQYNMDAVKTASSYLDMRTYLSVLPDERRYSQAERQVVTLLYGLSNRDKDILSYGILDLNGTVIIDSRTVNIGRSEAEFPHYTAIMENPDTYVSPVLYLPEMEEGVFYISTPIFSEMGILAGILRAEYSASVLQDLIASKEEGSELDSFFVLFDESNVILAHERLPELIGAQPSGETIDILANAEPFFEIDDNILDTSLTGAITKLDNSPWTVVAYQSQDIFTVPVRRQAQIFFLLAIGTVLFAIAAGSLIANLLAAPVLRLQTVAQRFADGDMAAQADVEAEDEVGQLAETFNTLVLRLNETIVSLEDRVKERTHDLELRSRYLEGASEIGRLATTFVDATELARTVVELIRDRFNLYYVGLFLADDNQEWAVLQAGTGEAGEIMLENQHRLKIGEGMIGWTVKYGEARIALDVGEDAVRFENPVLPQTRSEGALPLRSRGRVLGAITVQSAEPAAFSFEILTTLQTMADQIAIAFDNAKLLAQSEAALEAERRAYGELTMQSWRDATKRGKVSAFHVDSEGILRTLDRSVVETKHQALGDKQALQEDNGAVVVPIRSRGNIIGGVRIAKSEDSKWTKDQLHLISTLTEQLSVALESARLFEDTQLRAQREAIISDISAKVGASIRMDTILKTTVEELGKALSGADISFEITGPEKGAKPKE